MMPSCGASTPSRRGIEQGTFVQVPGLRRVSSVPRSRDGEGAARHPYLASLVITLSLLAFVHFSCVTGFADVARLHPKSGLKPFAYTNAPDVLPNYVAGAKWGTQTDPIRTMQLPLDPEESAKHIVVPQGFSFQLFAAEPDITKPICMAWDERGRLWIAETVDYPNELQPAGQGRDRIKICEDTDGDGRADKFTVFAEQLSIPTSLCFANGGLIVLESGHTLFLRDNDGDDKADERKVLFSGWGMGDTHATASNLRYDLDNWIWGTVGYSGFNGVVGGKSFRFGMGVYRFKPDGSALEFIRSTDNNTWGLGLSEDGTIFGSTANRDASWYMAIPNRFYEAVNGWSAARLETIADSQAIYPITEKVRQVDQHGMYTAGAGHALYTARSFPSNFWNRIAFVAEPTGHLVGWFALEPKGADFVARNLGSFLASDDEWCAPITAEVGPDGALWVIDWYNYIVQHNPVPTGFKNGKGNAYETRLRDKRHGRIYKVSSANGAASTQPRLSKATPDDLVKALANENQLWRLHAQRNLVERGRTDVIPALIQLANNRAVDAIGLNVGAIHALWTLNGLGALSTSPESRAAFVQALQHPSAMVRRVAVQAGPRDAEFADRLIQANLVSDPDPQVRLATLLALAEVPSSEPAGAMVTAALHDSNNTEDRWLRDAMTAAAARQLHGFGMSVLSDTGTFPKPAADVIRIVSRHYAASAPDGVTGLIEALPNCSPLVTGSVLDGLILGWPDGKPPESDEATRSSMLAAMKVLPPNSRDKLLVLALKWGQLDAFKDQVAAAATSLREQVSDSSTDDSTRLTAARNWIRLVDEPSTTTGLLELISPQLVPAVGTGLVAALGESRLDGTGAALLKQWNRLSPAQKRAGLAVLLRRPAWSGALLDAVAGGQVLRNDLGPEHWQQLRSSGNSAIASRARELANEGKTISADREAVVQKLMPASKATGDVVRGREVFTANCAVCHKFAGAGASVGPELTGIGARPREDILIDILDPNRSVEANYRLWNVTMKSGDTFSGRLDSETQTSVELYDLTGQKHTLSRQEIATLESSNLSMMPIGFESLGDKDLAALLTFLTSSSHP